MKRKTSDERFLAPGRANRVYDRIGSFQDWQIYERRALSELARVGSFGSTKTVIEFGCGTGAFAVMLLTNYLPSDCQYVGIDVSPKMVRLANSRIRVWGGRAMVRLSDGSPRLPELDGTFERFVSSYVFDLLAPDYAATVIAEAHRVLTDGGKLCLVGLARGTSGLPKALTTLWEHVWECKPEWVGGCRPVDLRTLIPGRKWLIEHHAAVVSFGITPELLIASRQSDKKSAEIRSSLRRLVLQPAGV